MPTCSCARRKKPEPMFTGIIQGLGEITALNHLGQESRLAIRPLFAMPDIVPGESIAVNGVCLSVEKSSGDQFWAYASGETLSRSNLKFLRQGARVNLERALALGDRLGGHIVSGHVDCLATVAEISPAGQSLRIGVSFPGQYSDEVISKGSVALDGISLTVNEAGDGFLSVNVIPDTRGRTNLGQWRKGSLLNMETDIIGKYARRMLAPWTGQDRKPAGGLDMDFLARNGFL